MVGIPRPRRDCRGSWREREYCTSNCDKLSDISTLTNGTVDPEEDVIASQLQDVFYSIDQVLDRAKLSIHQLGTRREGIAEESALTKWVRRYAVTVDDSDPDAIEIAVNLGALSEYQF